MRAMLIFALCASVCTLGSSACAQESKVRLVPYSERVRPATSPGLLQEETMARHYISHWFLEPPENGIQIMFGSGRSPELRPDITYHRDYSDRFSGGSGKAVGLVWTRRFRTSKEK